MNSYSELCVRAVFVPGRRSGRFSLGLGEVRKAFCEEVAFKGRLLEQSGLGVLPFKQVVREGLSEWV